MPYIKQDRRAILDFDVEDPTNAGELNFKITRIIQEYFRMHHNYQGINDIVGALEGAKLEFVRRVVNPYEDEAIKRNGDIY